MRGRVGTFVLGRCGMIARILEFVVNPKMLWMLIRWPKFSLASYKIVSDILRQDIAPKSVIDAGANVGQFTVAVSKLLAPRNIYAFEPLPGAYAKLIRHTKGIAGATVQNVALGERDGVVEFRVNQHSHSSSILALGNAHRAAFPYAVESELIQVPMTTLDNALDGIELPRPCLLKLDVQGYEDKVLEGAARTLKRVDYVVSELSFSPMYEGERSFTEMLELMTNYGFRFVRPLDFLRNPDTGEILQLDALFERF